MIPANKNKIIGSLFAFYHKRLLKKHFYSIHLTGMENLGSLDNTMPVILYANHSNWWDGFIAYFLTNRLLKKDDYLMMDIKQMKKYFFLVMILYFLGFLRTFRSICRPLVFGLFLFANAIV